MFCHPLMCKYWPKNHLPWKSAYAFPQSLQIDKMVYDTQQDNFMLQLSKFITHNQVLQCCSWQYHYYRQSTFKRSTAWLQTVFKEPKDRCLDEINRSRFTGSLCEIWTLSYKTLHPTL